MICSWAPRARANRDRVGRRGAGARDRPRLPCFPRALGRCLFRRCCLWLEASKCFRSACGELPRLVARAPTWRSGKVVLHQSPLLPGPPRAFGNNFEHTVRNCIAVRFYKPLVLHRNCSPTRSKFRCSPMAICYHKIMPRTTFESYRRSDPVR